MKLLTLVAATTILATPVLAADAVVYNESAPVVADTFSWTGGYIGVNAGYAGGRAKTDTTQIVEGDTDVWTDVYKYSDNASGFIGGIQAGYNWQFDRTIVGIETDIQASNIEAKYNQYDTTKIGTKIDWLGTTRVRLGYTPVDRFMVYATGGVAYGKIKHEIWNKWVEASDTRVGYTVGAGAEYAITNHVTLKTEYLYTDLGKLKFDQFKEDHHNFGSVKLPFHTVRVGVNYKF